MRVTSSEGKRSVQLTVQETRIVRKAGWILNELGELAKDERATTAGGIANTLAVKYGEEPKAT